MDDAVPDWLTVTTREMLETILGVAPESEWRPRSVRFDRIPLHRARAAHVVSEIPGKDAQGFIVDGALFAGAREMLVHALLDAAEVEGEDYSWRSASIGSSIAARCAG